MFSLIEIKQKIEQLAIQIDASANQMLPTYGTSKDDGTPYIEVEYSNYFYLAYDRDTKSINRKTQDIDELLYWVFAGVTFNMASSYASAHRDPSINYRRIMFSHQLELLEKLNPLWRKRREKEIDEILKGSPYSD